MMDGEMRERGLLWVLRMGTFLCFAGWAWMHLYWEGPYGVLFWQEDSFAMAEEMGVGWDEYVGTGANDGWIQKWISAIGWLYPVFAILALTVRKKSWVQMAGLGIGCAFLCLLFYAKFLKSGRQLPMFVEHGGQMLMPLILISALALGLHHRWTIGLAVAAFVMTFLGHGAYALNWWPTPGRFYGMMTLTLGVEYETAQVLVRLAGILDLVACVGLFVPWLRTLSLLYGIGWGLLTAVARPWAGMSTDLNYWGADQWIHEAVLRAPHFMIPLFLYLMWKRQVSAAKAVEGESGSTDELNLS